ncbi:MAG: hypothetical protein WA217_00320 [Candidatus Binatus sp.]
MILRRELRKTLLGVGVSIAIYPFKREFVVGAASIDTQGGFSTMCYLPGQHTPEHECWYINQGAVDKEFFTVRAMEAASQTGH